MLTLTRAETAQRDFNIYGNAYYMKRRDQSLLDVDQAVDEAERHVVIHEHQEYLHQLKS